MASGDLLKRDALGAIERHVRGSGFVVLRLPARARPGIRWLAARLAAREARALERLTGIDGVPRPLGRDGDGYARSWVEGAPLHRGPRPGRAFFRDARRLLRQIHRAGITHNDLAKEANWLQRPDGRAGIVDFQLAVAFERRSRGFRLLAREDLRHLLKHQRQYLPETLTARERALLARPALPAVVWRRAAKPVYRLVTRGLLGWPERNGAEERGAPAAAEGRRHRRAGRV